MFNSYSDEYENVRMKREDGILEVTLHTRSGPLLFDGYVHEALVGAFRDIGDDPENHVVILTGTGDEFCAHITGDGFDFFTPSGYDKILREGTKVLENILDLQVPMIAAINGGLPLIPNMPCSATSLLPPKMRTFKMHRIPHSASYRVMACISCGSRSSARFAGATSCSVARN
jgi:hypothetical protein